MLSTSPATMIAYQIIFILYMIFLSAIFHVDCIRWKETSHFDEWFTAFDRCILANQSRVQPHLIFADCEQRMRSIGEIIKPLRCQVGNSWPSKSGYCASDDIPFSERKALRQIIKEFDDPSMKPLKEYFELMSKERSALLLVGDSVMQQFYSAIACELEREGVWKHPSKFTNTDEIQHVHDVPIKFVPLYHFVNSKWDKIANASMHHLKKAIERIISDREGLMIIINVGLHYVSNPEAHFSRSDYQQQVTMALHYLNDYVSSSKKKVRVIWRETSAQHFPTSNGYWPGVRYSKDMILKCSPINDTSPDADWRNNDVAAIVRANSFTNVRIMPFYEATLPMWSLHVNGFMRDCTHFCWSPMLYQSLFHSMLHEMKQKHESDTHTS